MAREFDHLVVAARTLEEGATWIEGKLERTDDIDEALRDYSERVEILSLSRGKFRWRIGVPSDGRLPRGGALPTLIQWEGEHPADSLPSSGCALRAFEHSPGRLEATLSTPAGERRIRGPRPE